MEDKSATYEVETRLIESKEKQNAELFFFLVLVSFFIRELILGRKVMNIGVVNDILVVKQSKHKTRK